MSIDEEWGTALGSSAVALWLLREEQQRWLTRWGWVAQIDVDDLELTGRAFLAPGLMDALDPREDESHSGTEEVPGGASGASDPAHVGCSEGPGFSTWRGASDR